MPKSWRPFTFSSFWTSYHKFWGRRREARRLTNCFFASALLLLFSRRKPDCFVLNTNLKSLGQYLKKVQQMYHKWKVYHFESLIMFKSSQIRIYRDSNHYGFIMCQKYLFTDNNCIPSGLYYEKISFYSRESKCRNYNKIYIFTTNF